MSNSAAPPPPPSEERFGLSEIDEKSHYYGCDTEITSLGEEDGGRRRAATDFKEFGIPGFGIDTSSAPEHQRIDIGLIQQVEALVRGFSGNRSGNS